MPGQPEGKTHMTRWVLQDRQNYKVIWHIERSKSGHYYLTKNYCRRQDGRKQRLPKRELERKFGELK